MLRPLIPLAVSLALLGCAEMQQSADAVARTSARAAVDEVLVTRFPGIDGTRVTPYTNCLIDNATRSEIANLARAAVAGVNEATVSLITGMIQRPEISACLLRAGLAPQT